MSAPSRAFRGFKQTLRPGLVSLIATLSIGAVGAITAQTGAKLAGFTVARTNSGRYLITLSDTWPTGALVHWSIGLDAGAGYAGTEGIIPCIRNVNLAARTIEMFLITAAAAPAEFVSGGKVSIELVFATQQS